jgi:hypothetical protein
MNPIFIFSLPRSGSTLLQRILASHKKIASIAEPWLLLPFVYSIRKEGILAEYSHFNSRNAITDMINELPNKTDDYYEQINLFASSIYQKLCKDSEIYFVDKTPRYYFIIQEIDRIFPNAKYIFLFRNPVHVYSSILRSWGDNRFKNIYRNYLDLNEGPRLMNDGYKALRDKAYAVKYEELVTTPERYIKEICEYLELDYDNEMLAKFAEKQFSGRMGDSTGVQEYKDVDASSLSKWKITFSNAFRKHKVYNYIEMMDEKILTDQGYSKEEILHDIRDLDGSITGRYILLDILDYYRSFLIRKFKLNQVFKKRGQDRQTEYLS